MPNPKPQPQLPLALACTLVILGLGVGCGEEIDPDYPCGQDALKHAIHVREVSRENDNRFLFRRQPNFHSVMEHFIRDEEGSWSDEYGIVIRVGEKMDRDTLPPEDRVPDEIDGVTIYIDGAPWNYTGGLIEGVFEKDPERQYAAAVGWKNEDLFFRQPNRSRGSVGVGILGKGGRPGEPLSVQIGILVTEKVDQSTLPPEDRIPDCLEGIPVTIREFKPNSG